LNKAEKKAISVLKMGQVNIVNQEQSKILKQWFWKTEIFSIGV
jgi:hypothetical protein